MSYLLTLLHQAATTGLIYTALIVLAALISLLAPTSTRRSDARETLKILPAQARTNQAMPSSGSPANNRQGR